MKMFFFIALLCSLVGSQRCLAQQQGQAPFQATLDYVDIKGANRAVLWLSNGQSLNIESRHNKLATDLAWVRSNYCEVTVRYIITERGAEYAGTNLGEKSRTDHKCRL